MINCAVVGIVMLNELAKSSIPNFDAAIDRSSSNTSAIRSKLARQDFRFMLNKIDGGDSFDNIPQLNTPVIGAREKHPLVWGYIAFSDPVGVTSKRLLEFAFGIPHLDSLVRRTADKKVLISG